MQQQKTEEEMIDYIESQKHILKYSLHDELKPEYIPDYITTIIFNPCNIQNNWRTLPKHVINVRVYKLYNKINKEVFKYVVNLEIGPPCFDTYEHNNEIDFLPDYLETLNVHGVRQLPIELPLSLEVLKCDFECINGPLPNNLKKLHLIFFNEDILQGILPLSLEELYIQNNIQFDIYLPHNNIDFYLGPQGGKYTVDTLPDNIKDHFIKYEKPVKNAN